MSDADLQTASEKIVKHHQEQEEKLLRKEGYTDGYTDDFSGGDNGAVFFKRKVAGIEQVKLDILQVPLVRCHFPARGGRAAFITIFFFQ